MMADDAVSHEATKEEWFEHAHLVNSGRGLSAAVALLAGEARGKSAQADAQAAGRLAGGATGSSIAGQSVDRERA